MDGEKVVSGKGQNTPTVSILMAVYNGSHYTPYAINSMLNQTFNDFEFIIINDASTDQTERLIRKIAKNDSRIQLINNKQNLGLTKSLNKGLRRAKGRFVARMDADDISHPERLEKQVHFLQDNLEITLIGTSGHLIDSEGRTIREIKKKEDFMQVLIGLFFDNQFLHSSIMFRREPVVAIGGYDEAYKAAQDYNLYFRLINNGSRITNIDIPLIEYRVHEDNVTSTLHDQQESFALEACCFGWRNLLNLSVSYQDLKHLRMLRYHGRRYMFNQMNHMNRLKLLWLLRSFRKKIISTYELSPYAASFINDQFDFFSRVLIPNHYIRRITKNYL